MEAKFKAPNVMGEAAKLEKCPTPNPSPAPADGDRALRGKLKGMGVGPGASTNPLEWRAWRFSRVTEAGVLFVKDVFGIRWPSGPSFRTTETKTILLRSQQSANNNINNNNNNNNNNLSCPIIMGLLVTRDFHVCWFFTNFLAV